MDKEKTYSKIDIVAGHWVPTIVSVENGFIVSCKTPRSDLDITEVYVYKTLEEVYMRLKDLFNE